MSYQQGAYETIRWSVMIILSELTTVLLNSGVLVVILNSLSFSLNILNLDLFGTPTSLKQSPTVIINMSEE